MSKTKPSLLVLLSRIQAIERVPRLIVWLVQLSIFVLSGLAAFLLRFDFIVPAYHVQYLIWALPIWLIAKAVAFRVCDLDRGWWRFVSVHDVFRIGVGNLLGSSASAVLIFALAPRGFPRSLYILDFLICFLSTTSVRVFTRIVQDSLQNGRETGSERAVLIYGAGAAGVTLLREIRSNPALHYKVPGFVDDNPQKRGIVIQGVKVLGSGNALAVLILKHKIEEVLIALPSATGQEMTTILTRCHQAGVRCRTIPALAEMIEGRPLANQIREVAVEDLLGRTQVRLEEHQIRSSLEGKVVLVTGAAGSIGSELCRQIARFHPAGIVGFEIAESPLFEMDREMHQAFPQIPFHPEIGSIQNRARLDEVLSQYSPSVIYHAAAYKHVPLMEAHVFEAIENNVFGTYNVAMAAAEHGVEDFVMISSDKAVRPTNIMGTTKRIAELLLLALQNGRTKYVAVRFGNVLGSNGSVIPIFKKQIAAGGPVTVTHPDMRRFFMTIPEACQLVLQASAIGEGGQICVLDMGEPVKIVDLARNLILLSGLKPDEDIKIEFTGMRPGEKLYEELSTMLEDTAPTAHEKIRIYTGNGMPEGDMLAWLDCLREICETRDVGRLVVTLKEIVLDYSPSTHLLKRVIEPRGGRRAVSTATY
jgi:FlaA1/EpsC-like NDP-sugar epimerase